MQHRDLYPHEILQDVIDKSYAKSQGHLKTLSILSFLGGGYVSFGYMAYLKVVSGIPPEWSGLSTLHGQEDDEAVFLRNLENLFDARKVGKQIAITD